MERVCRQCKALRVVLDKTQIAVARRRGERDPRRAVVIYREKYACLHFEDFAEDEIRGVF